MKAIERHRKTWQDKSDEWLFERLDNELKQKVDEIHRLLAENLNTPQKQPLLIADVVSRFSGENLMKLQKHFVSLYGSDEMAQEKANSFAVGFGKACEIMCKDLQNGL